MSAADGAQSNLDRRQNCLSVELFQTTFSRSKRIFFLAKSEADLGCPVAWVVVKAGAGDHGDANGFDEKLGEAHILRIGLESNRIRIREARDIRHDVIRAAGFEHSETSARENLQQPLALGSIRGGKLDVVGLWKVKCTGTCLLERGRSA